MTATIEAAYARLSEVDPVLAGLAGRLGTPDPASWAGSAEAGDDPFTGLVLHVIGQQISVAAALAVFGRLVGAVGGPPVDPRALTRLGHDRLRRLGLSGAKALALEELAASAAAGDVRLEELAACDDAAAHDVLVRLRGVGPWSAQMFLMHQLRRPDVFPSTDVGLQRAIQRAWGLDARPTPGQVAVLSTRWAPYRSYAAALLWASLRA